MTHTNPKFEIGNGNTITNSASENDITEQNRLEQNYSNFYSTASMMIKKEELITAYQDLTGRFPIRSTAGNEYILVCYHYDSNCILGHPVKNRTGPVLTKAWQHMQEQFGKAGVAPEVWILDNEISTDLTNSFKDNKTKYQLVPPHSHRRNSAERAIQTWKNHFKAGLATTDPNFPLTAWDHLIPQTNITLNLLRSARANPNVCFGNWVLCNSNFGPLNPNWAGGSSVLNWAGGGGKNDRMTFLMFLCLNTKENSILW